MAILSPDLALTCGASDVMLCLLVLILVVAGVRSEGNSSTENTVHDFQKLFKHKRSIQLEAINGLLNLAKYETKYQMVNRMFEKIFELHDQSWSMIQNSDYIPGGEDPLAEPPLPSDMRLRESLSTLLENCALVGEVVLRLPDISDRLLRKKTDWMHNVKHCISFSPSTRLIDDVTEEMLRLAAQELNLVSRTPDFTNPYRQQSQGPANKRTNSRKMEL